MSNGDTEVQNTDDRQTGPIPALDNLTAHRMPKLTQLRDDSLVNHPAHYGGDTTYEVIKVIEAWELGFHLGNVVKYVARAEHKGDRLKDLEKAAWYLDREIEKLRNS